MLGDTGYMILIESFYVCSRVIVFNFILFVVCFLLRVDPSSAVGHHGEYGRNDGIDHLTDVTNRRPKSQLQP